MSVKEKVKKHLLELEKKKLSKKAKIAKIHKHKCILKKAHQKRNKSKKHK